MQVMFRCLRQRLTLYWERKFVYHEVDCQTRLVCGCKIILQYLSVGLYSDTLYCIVLSA